MCFYYKHNGVLYNIQLSIEEFCDLINIFFEDKPYKELLKLKKRCSYDNDSAWLSQLVSELELEPTFADDKIE